MKNNSEGVGSTWLSRWSTQRGSTKAVFVFLQPDSRKQLKNVRYDKRRKLKVKREIRLKCEKEFAVYRVKRTDVKQLNHELPQAKITKISDSG